MSESSDTDVMQDPLADSPPSPFDQGEDAVDSLEAEGFEEGDSYSEDMGDEFAGDADLGADVADELGADFAESGSGDSYEVDVADYSDADAMAAWNAFEEEIADGLDAADDDEFL